MPRMRFFSIEDDMKTTRVSLEVDSEGEVVFLNNFGPAVDVTIPAVLPDGNEVTAISSNFCKGQFNKITIENDISNVRAQAFCNAHVKEIVWPLSCHEIPELCFWGSDICSVSNTEGVRSIRNKAFCNARFLDEIDFSSSHINCADPMDFEMTCKVLWPEGIKFCDWADGVKFKVDGNGCLRELRSKGGCPSVIIPRVLSNGIEIKSIGSDFVKGKFETITISDDIAAIDCGAFRMSNIDKVIWSSSCLAIPDFCFHVSMLKKITNLNNVTEIGENAFLNTHNLRSLDLSSSLVSFVGPYAFDKNCDVKLPYYLVK